MKKTVKAVSTALLSACVLAGCGIGTGLPGTGGGTGHPTASPGPTTSPPTPTASPTNSPTGTPTPTGTQTPTPTPTPTPPDDGGDDDGDGDAVNVILMVGDGMGTAQRDAIRLASVGLTGELAMDSLPEVGRVHTNSADPETFITDSAAAATSMATGVKTYNGAIGVDLAQQPVSTALEVAERLGKSSGLVTTSQVTDATPAAFGSHVLDRNEQSAIAAQFLRSSHPEVILGGGEDYWYPAGNPGRYPDNPAEDESEESAGTEGNLVEEAQEQGYEYVWDLPGLEAAEGDMLLGLFANEEMFQYGDDIDDAYDPAVPLTEMTRKAIDVLDNNQEDNGFFLMVEEEGTDAMSHVNNGALTIESGIEFDRSVALAKEYAEQDGNTLLITVGDHETGGMSIEPLGDDSNPDSPVQEGPFDVANSDQQFQIDWTTGGHTGDDVPLTAMGPGSEMLTGVYENTRIFDVMVSVMRSGTDRDFDLQAHRGGRGEVTEESLAAFAHSLELGVTTLELDAVLTEDERVIVWHDDLILATKCADTAPATAGDAEFPYVGDRVADLTLAQVQTLDCGYAQLPGYPEQDVAEGNRIAELSDVYDLAREYRARRIHFNVETKVEEGLPGGPRSVALTEAVVDVVRDSGRERRTTIQSFDWSTLNLVDRIAPELTLVALASTAQDLGVGQPGAAPQLGGIDIDDFGGDVAWAAAAQGYDVISPIFTTVTAELVQSAHNRGLTVIPWTVNEVADMHRLIDLGVDGIITDYPTRLRAVLAERGFELPRPYQR
ncbi:MULTISPECIES: alkaline phosphatase [unclassified Arthrobacter]|uniref:alkaline phosphatase n=1 Tax=unclassified Arthrobacter TaxID=235627 RepID=UPI001E4339DA|nr:MULTISPECIES: alkaline phosphatase [unclassified Arthrobacter]MCC9145278.1 alkaline phosphatase [Arthrobacter sp. zg-Y919]MDK1276506.1 alkaline phosphatase [Arthrobacter sp. zg.Y919]WIB01899.1 alkaline phosphatase [Arthrobacter sp. zg-Y919]